ncbi:MAG: stage III sporulation protein AF [Clostridia bacterium]|nr:stage III sporulation protein AF [Clostridia bacterium]
MSEWLIGVVGIIALGLLLEILIPEGQTSKYVKGAFSLLVIFAVISPLPKLLNGEYQLDFVDTEYSVDRNYLVYVTSRYTSSIESDLEKVLAEQGIDSGVEIVIKEGSVKDIEFVQVKIHFTGIDKNQENTHITRAREIVKNALSISQDKIDVRVLYGSD